MMDKENSKKFELEYKKGNNALLLGNGINNLNPDFRWDALLRELDGKINLVEKPYTLAFEEIVLNKLACSSNSESYKEILKGIKDTIAEHCSKIEPNGYHNKFQSLNISTFLTTNYDYAIEKTLDEKFDIAKVKRTTNDFKYSLNRYHIVNNKKVWHIHGEIDNGYKRDNIDQYASASIMIGHEHYGDYYRRIHQYLRPFDTDIEAKQKINKKDSWVKIFFTHDMHIVGLSLDSSEFHLWWLLAYRARLKGIDKSKIKNKIFYHCASYDTHSAKDKAKIELLKSYDVKIKEIAVKNTDEDKYKKYWEAFFNDINSIIENNEQRKQ
jgi:hypothetical protein